MQNKTNLQAKAKSLTWVSYKTKDLVWTIGFVAASIITPAILAHTPNNQWITGTIVNAVLFLSAWRLGMANSILVAAFPSSIALLRGLLPAPMAMMIPFIIISNIILVLVFSLLYQRHPKLSFCVAMSGLAKFAFLFFAVSAMASKLSPLLIHMLTWPQLITALAGGIVAAGGIKIINRFAIKWVLK